MIQIVDEDDNLIGYKERSEVDYDKDIYRGTALWTTNSKGKVLLAQRKHTKDKDPGKWGPAVSGTVDEGETYETNIYKEAEEEISLEAKKFDFGPKIRVKYPRNFFCQWFTLVLDENYNFKPQEEEVEELKWVAERELSKDVREHPVKYIPTMPEIVKMFVKD